MRRRLLAPCVPADHLESKTLPERLEHQDGSGRQSVTAKAVRVLRRRSWARETALVMLAFVAGIEGAIAFDFPETSASRDLGKGARRCPPVRPSGEVLHFVNAD